MYKLNGKLSKAHPANTLVRVFSIALVLVMTAGAASATPVLWGIDEDDGQLFSIDDYTQITVGEVAAGLTIYGHLKWNDNGRIRNIGKDMEAMALDSDGMAYIALDDRLGSVKDQVLLRFDTNTATATGDNVAEVVGRIAGGKTGNITGLAINPLSGDLYALDKHGGTNRLLTINKTDGGLITDVGRMSGLGERVCRGEDMAFDSAGYLYVADDSDDELYRVSAATAAIVAVVDNKLEGGLGKKPRFEALAWDAESARMVGYSDRCDYFAQITLENGNNSSYGRFAELTDVEGMRFAAAPAVPEPGTLGVIIVGGVLTLIRRSRRK